MWPLLLSFDVQEQTISDRIKNDVGRENQINHKYVRENGRLCREGIRWRRWSILVRACLLQIPYHILCCLLDVQFKVALKQCYRFWWFLSTVCDTRPG